LHVRNVLELYFLRIPAALEKISRLAQGQPADLLKEYEFKLHEDKKIDTL